MRILIKADEMVVELADNKPEVSPADMNMVLYLWKAAGFGNGQGGGATAVLPRIDDTPGWLESRH
jgi:hypothetical protein